MRLWPRRSTPERPVPAPRRPFANLDNLEHLIDEGYLVAASALRLATKNELILTTLRDGGSWNEDDAVGLARRAADSLIIELTATAARLTRESERAAPAVSQDDDSSAAPQGLRRPGRAERARLARERKRIERQREEADRLIARTRTMLGVIDRVRATRDDDDALREISLRARDDTLAELVQARLIPRRAIVQQTEEEQREAIAGVKVDLARLLEERTGY
jgi:hypothetical protein